MIQIQQHIGRVFRIHVAIPDDGDLRKLLVPDKPYLYRCEVARMFIDKGTVQDIDALLSFDSDLTQKVLQGVCCRNDRFDLFDHLLTVGAVLDKTCLNNAVFLENVDMVDKLLSLGCPMSKLILYSVDVEMATKLILYGAKIDHCSKFYGSPLQSAVENNNVAMVKLLLSFGAQVTEELINEAKRRGIPPIIQALEHCA